MDFKKTPKSKNFEDRTGRFPRELAKTNSVKLNQRMSEALDSYRKRKIPGPIDRWETIGK